MDYLMCDLTVMGYHNLKTEIILVTRKNTWGVITAVFET